MAVAHEELVPLAQASTLFPGPRRATGTIVRWAMRGIGKDRIKLETVLIGGRRYVNRAAADEFLQRLNARSGAIVDQQRTESIRRAETELDQDGIK